MTNEITQENQTISKIIEVSNLNDLILTFNGKVVGHVEIEEWETKNINGETATRVEFVGRPVNVIDYDNGYFTTNGFASGSAIQASDKSEVATAKDFVVAYAEASK